LKVTPDRKQLARKEKEMGREIKRVAMDFNWPLGQVWGGFINPFSSQSIECPDCDGSGSSPEAKLMRDRWYGYVPFKPEDRGSVPFTIDDPPVRAFAERNVARSPRYYWDADLFTKDQIIVLEAKRLCRLWNKSWTYHLNADDVAALIEVGRLMDFTHTWKNGAWTLKDPPYIPTPKEVNDWSLTGFGHDSCNQWVVADAECKRLGYETQCPRCKGEGTVWPSLEIKERHDVWESTEPPSGDGYQLWETVSEGSPISPVFATPEELADWLAIPENQKGVDKGTTRDQ
jgi:hypothetical protein